TPTATPTDTTEAATNTPTATPTGTTEAATATPTGTLTQEPTGVFLPPAVDFNTYPGDNRDNTVFRTNSAGVFVRVIVSNGVYIRNPAEIGVQGVINLGVLQAVDVFAVNGSAAGVTVCLFGAGDLIFLSAAASPRTPGYINEFVLDNMTCAILPTAGTLVLVPEMAGNEAFETFE
ncbi:MAG: hypothetical protein IAE80_17035, partial [Anaerolinea sp.]|nr:hypothetical protein [Anaerolinea sp.]